MNRLTLYLPWTVLEIQPLANLVRPQAETIAAFQTFNLALAPQSLEPAGASGLRPEATI